jgi:hypothetical protein
MMLHEGMVTELMIEHCLCGLQVILFCQVDLLAVVYEMSFLDNTKEYG